MVEFDYTIKDELGIHVRPAGKLAQVAKELKSTVTFEHDGKSADVTKLFAVMGMAIKCGDSVHVKVEGEDEQEAAKAVEEFLNENL